MPLLVGLLAALIIVPIIEISAIVYVGDHIGVLPTVALLIGSALLGSWLLRREGRRAWRSFRSALDSGRPPAREAVEGVLVLLGGLMMMLPGFATDVLGLLLVVPPVRRLVAGLVLARLLRGLPASLTSDLLGPARVRSRRGPARPEPPPAPAGTRLPPAPGEHKVIEGQVLDGQGVDGSGRPGHDDAAPPK